MPFRVLGEPFSSFRGLGNSGGGAFSPDALGNLILWLRADQGVFTDVGKTTPANNGDMVYVWEDQTSQGNDAVQAVAPNRPIFQTAIFNNKPVVRADGTQWLLAPRIDFMQADPFWLAAVIASTNVASSSVIDKGLGNANSFSFYVQSLAGDLLPRFAIQNGGSVIVASAVDIKAGNATYCIIQRNVTDDELRLRVNATNAADVPDTTVGNFDRNSPTGIFCRGSDTVLRFTGDIAEALIGYGELSDIDVGNLATYFSNKYGI